MLCCLAGLFCLLLVSTAMADQEEHHRNRLADEVSPYLRLHAHNPVDWYPWGEEALQKARRENKPIFLSVGYSTCYWCHVMERLVFADAEIAAQMNAWFVNIKVDREERPDLDQIYMTATQLLSGHGGWPNSVFLTPDLEPFFAGTYFPPEDTYGRPGFPRVLHQLHEAWELRRAEVLKVAARVTEAIRELEAGQQAPPMDPDSVLVSRALAGIRGRYDAEYGGFGGPPKFPPCMRLDFLLGTPERRADPRLMGIVEHTLATMARGGLFDQLGGGFHRYATDAEWRIPHFEKMLYNQAHMARLFLRAYRLTGAEEWRRTAKEIFRFVRREMTSDGGGFYSALDAETEGVEGKYYLWTGEEIEAILGEDAELFFEVYGLESMPDDEGGVLFVATPPDEVASEREMAAESLREKVGKMRSQLLQVRSQRAYPLLDDKQLTSWNGMMISAFAYGYEVLGVPEYRETATAAAGFVLEQMRTPDGGLWRSYRQGEVRRIGYLEDYAFFSQSLLDLHRATGEKRWLALAEEIADQMILRFWDEGAGGFFISRADPELIVRSKTAQDGALPAANAVAVHALLELAARTEKEIYLEKAGQTLRAFGGMMQAQPGGFTHMVAAAERYLGEYGDRALKPAPLAMVRQAEAVDEVVQIRVEVERIDPAADFQVAVHLDIRDGWHINAHPAAADWLLPTSLTIGGELPIERVDVRYPRGTPLLFAPTGDTLQVYGGQVTVRADLRLRPEAASDQSGDLNLLIRYQACNENRCLQPVEWMHSVRLQIAQP